MVSVIKTESRSNEVPQGLPLRLVKRNLVDSEDIINDCKAAKTKGTPLIEYLLDNNRLSADDLAEAIASEYGIPLIDLMAIDFSSSPVDIVSEQLLRKHNALPIRKSDNVLYVAFSDPTSEAAVNDIAFNANLLVQPIVAPNDQIVKVLDDALANANSMFDSMGDDEGLEDLDFENEEEALKKQEKESAASLSDDKPIVKFVNKVLVDAIRRGASDIHFEPYENQFRIRLRLDGVLKTVLKPPNRMAQRLSARLKVMASLDIAEKRVPQDGRIKLNLGRGSIDFRVSTCPTLFGEKVVLRILDSSVTKIGVENLGFDPHQMEHFNSAVKKPYGMILVTGPTGSGKTVTLYTGLNMLNDDGRNISTAEDPVEIRVPGINQVQQNVKAGMTFAAALRSFLRQDPDVIMVGEIRDLETAEIAIKAAQTGHLVLSTLHTNDAPQSVTRLVNMGVPSYNITSALHLVVAQRLARRLHTCKQPSNLPEEVLREAGFTEEEIADNVQVFEAGSCNECNEGYKGRSGIFQVMPVGEEIERLILDGGNAIDIAKLSQELGYNDLRRSALNKVKDGVTSLVEISRVTKS